MATADQTTRVAITADAGQANREMAGFADRVQQASRASVAAVGSMGQGMVAASASMQALQNRAEGLQATVAKLAGQQQLINSFVAQKAATQAAEQAMAQAQATAQGLGRQMAGLDAPTKAQTAAFERARQAVRESSAALQAQRLELQRLRGSLGDAGISTTSLASAQVQLSARVASSRRDLQALAEQAARTAAAERQAAQAAEQARANVAQPAGAATSAMAGLRTAAAGALSVFAAISAVRGLVTIADQATLADARIRQVTGSIQAATEANQALYALAQRLQTPFAEAQAMFARMLPAVQDLKGGAREATALAEILITTARLGGASAAEAASSAQQFAQALGSGVLQGDELKSLLENNQPLARELAAALGVNVGALKEMGAAGKLTSDVVANALLGTLDRVRAQGAELPVTVGGGLQQIQNAAAAMFNTWQNGSGVLAFVAQLFGEVARIIDLVTAQMRLAGQQSGTTAGATVSAAQAMGSAFAYVVDVVRALIANITAAGNMVGALAAASTLAAQGNFGGAMAAIGDGWRRNAVAGNQLVDALLAKGKTLQGYSAVLSGDGVRDERRAGPAGTAGGFARLQGAAKAATAKPGSGAGPDSRMPQWEADLADRRLALARQAAIEGQHREMSKAEEAKYWADLAARRDIAQKERIPLARKVAEAELATLRETHAGKVQALQDEAAQYRANFEEKLRIELQIQAMYAQGTQGYAEAARRITELRRAAAQQAAAVADEEQAALQQRQLAEVAVAEQTMQTLRQLGQADAEQVLQAQAAFEQRRYQIHLDALQQRLQAAQADPDRNPVELARIHTEIEALQQQHRLRMGQIQGAAAVESARQVNDTLGNIQQGWASLIQQMAQGTLSISGFIRGIFSTVAQAVVQTLAGMAAQWAVQQIAMRLFGQGQTKSTIAAKAAEAGAAGTASMAGAPFPMNMTAPFFGAAMATAASSFAALAVASAAGGYDIPGGTNPLVQTHAREMILPATLADTVRDMARVYDGAGPGGGGGTDTAPVQLRVVASMGDWIMANRHDLDRALARVNRDKLRRS